MIYTDYESLFERFCILTIDGGMTDEQAFDYLRNKTTVPLFNQLYAKIKQIEINNNMSKK